MSVDSLCVQVCVCVNMYIRLNAHTHPYTQAYGECPCSVIIKVVGCRIVVCEFELQSSYYVHFRSNTFEKGMNLLILTARG